MINNNNDDNKNAVHIIKLHKLVQNIPFSDPPSQTDREALPTLSDSTAQKTKAGFSAVPALSCIQVMPAQLEA